MTVVNLSRVALTEAEINLLLKGFFFSLTPHYINKNELLDNLESYFRRLCIKEFFLEDIADAEEEQNDTPTLFCPPSTWMPPKGKDPGLERYVRRIRKDVEHKLNICDTTDFITKLWRLPAVLLILFW